VRHLEAGLIVGAIWMVVILIAIGLIAFLGWLMGSVVAMAILATTIIIILGASFIDWYSERKRKP
jgi:fatty acid desaturase